MNNIIKRNGWAAVLAVGTAFFLTVPLYAAPHGGGAGERGRKPQQEMGRRETRTPFRNQGKAPQQNFRRNDHGHAFHPPAPPRQHRGYWETRTERYWVEGFWQSVVDAYGRLTHAWHPGYWDTRVNRVWIP